MLASSVEQKRRQCPDVNRLDSWGVDNLDNKLVFKYFVFLFLVFVFTSVNAFPVESPSELELTTREAFFFVEITNPYSVEKDLTINFFAPTNIRISAPNSIPPFETIIARIFIENNFSEFTRINSTLEVYLGNELEKREISLRFHQTKTEFSNNTMGEGLIAFFALFNLENITIEFGLTFLLSLIILVLLIMLIIRISRRV